jgi:hypothetical protein
MSGLVAGTLSLRCGSAFAGFLFLLLISDKLENPYSQEVVGSGSKCSVALSGGSGNWEEFLTRTTFVRYSDTTSTRMFDCPAP